MDIKTNSEVTISLADLEVYLKEKRLIHDDQTLHGIALVDTKTLKLTFTNDPIESINETMSLCAITASAQLTHEHIRFMEQPIKEISSIMSARLRNKLGERIDCLKQLSHHKFLLLVMEGGFGKKTGLEFIGWLDVKGLKLTDLALEMLGKKRLI